jgi:VWFA-related protein
MSLSALQRLTPRFGAPLFVALTAAFGPDDEMIAFRYDRSVFKLSDFTTDPLRIQDSFKVISAIEAARPPEPIPVFGDRRPGWLQSIFAVLEFGHKPPRKGRVLNDAIYDAAMSMQGRDPDRRKIVFVISDGQTSGASQTHTLEQTTDLLLKNDIQVYSVSPEAPAFGYYKQLTSYATATGGDVFEGTSAGSMENGFSRITDQARNQYVLGYVSTNVVREGRVFRNIVVKMHDPNQKVIHRKGYVQYSAP